MGMICTALSSISVQARCADLLAYTLYILEDEQ